MTATFFSKFKELPRASELRAIAGCIPRLTTLPFWSLPNGSYERNYLGTVYDILMVGRAKASRPGQYTLMKDDVQFSIDISGGVIPLPTTKFVPYRSFLVETLWFLSGSTDIAYLKANGVSIWDDWVLPGTEVFEEAEKHTAQEVLNYMRLVKPLQYADWNRYKSENNIGRPTLEHLQAYVTFDSRGFESLETKYPKVRLVSGSIGKGAYGGLWRDWSDMRVVPVTTMADHNRYEERSFDLLEGEVVVQGELKDIYHKSIDQVQNVIDQLRTSPDSRRIIVTAWNPALVPEAALPPCHNYFQFTSTVNEDTQERELTLKLVMRSSDFLVGGPFNIGQYAMLAHMVAHVTGHKATKLIFSPNDCHIYEDQLPFVVEQLTRVPMFGVVATMSFDEAITEIDQFNLENIAINGYYRDQVHPMIPYPVAV